MQRVERLSSIKYLRNPSFSKNDHLAHDRLNTVIKYIQENYQNSINLEDMANQTFMVPAAFSRWFKQTMNIGFNEYLNKYRVEEACRQMISTQKTLSVISEDCGFDSHSTFHRAFLKAKNISPSKYRMHVRNTY
jgi:AraC-like DNA-binding protein